MTLREVAARAASVLVLATGLTACAGGPDVTPDAAAVIQRLEAVEPMRRWTFSYRPDSPSPYLACLQGIDEITGSVDVAEGIVWLQPSRDAPAIAVTEDTIAVPDPEIPGSWLATPWPTKDDEALTDMFGETLAGHIRTGLRLPDPNMTVMEMFTVATSVETADDNRQEGSDTLVIVADIERFNDAANSDVEPLDALTVTAVVDPTGRVTTMIVDASPIAQSESTSPHRNRYAITANYDGLDPFDAAPTNAVIVDPADLQYPNPQSSCEFRS